MALLDKYNSVENRRRWQAFLNTQGFRLSVDGIDGPATRRATAAWQTAQSLKNDGIVGEQTIAAASVRGFEGFLMDDEHDLIEKSVAQPSDSHTALFPGSKIDQINAAMLARVSPALQRRGRLFIDAAKADGVTLQIVQGIRTFSEQDALYAKGRTRPGPRVTNARGGQSMHNYGLALDLAPVVNGKISWDDSRFVNYGKWADAAGLEWGGRWKKFKDFPHVQDTEGMKLAEVQAVYRIGGLNAVWNRVK